MSVIRNTAWVVLVLAGMACWAQSKSAQVVDDRLQPPEGPSSFSKGGDRHPNRGGQRGKHEKVGHAGVAHPPAALVKEPQPAPAPPPATLAQQPPNAPQVSYRNGLLTVSANNSTLSDILNLVRSKTGASIEFPDGLSQERVAAVVGPAPAPQVLATLLNGTRFDYILLGMNGRPDLLQRAIITPRESGGAAAAAAGPAAQARAATPAAGAEEEPEAPEETVEQPEEAPQPQAQPAQTQPGQTPVPQQQFPQPQYPQQQFPQQQPPGEQPQPGQPKTPEQLLQELQRMQQQQQQQQRQQQPPQQ